MILATSPVGRAPARHRGRDTLEWLVECGFFRQRPQDLPDPSVMAAPQPLLARGGRSPSLQALARAGVTLVGRLVAVHGEQVAFDNSVPANIAAGNAFAAWIRAMLDHAIRRAGLDLPPVEPDDADTPIELDPPTALDLRAVGVGSVVWVHRLHRRLLLASSSPPGRPRAATAPRRRRPPAWRLVRRAALAHPPRLRQLPRLPHRRSDHRQRRCLSC